MSESCLPLSLVPISIAPAVLALTLLLVIVVLALVMSMTIHEKSRCHCFIVPHLIFGARLLADVLTLPLSAPVHPVSLIPGQLLLVIIKTLLIFHQEFLITCSPVPVLPLHDPVSVCGLVGPVPVIAHPPVLVIAPVTEHPSPLGDLAGIDLALTHDTTSEQSTRPGPELDNKPPIRKEIAQWKVLLSLL